MQELGYFFRVALWCGHSRERALRAAMATDAVRGLPRRCAPRNDKRRSGGETAGMDERKPYGLRWRLMLFGDCRVAALLAMTNVAREGRLRAWMRESLTGCDGD